MSINSDVQDTGVEDNTPGRTRTILAGLVGNIMEWYDFAIYGYFAATIGKQFFPSEDPAISLIASFGAFAAGFLARPLGGIVFGRIGDIVGRKRVLMLSVMAMAIPTTLIAFLPGYESIGILAPITLVLLRIIQGLSVGGEYTSSIVFLVEQAPAKRRSFFAVWGMWGATLGILAGSAVGDVVATVLTDEQIADWGWRAPFLLGSLVAISCLLVRRFLTKDTPSPEVSSPVKQTFMLHYPTVIKVILLNIGTAVSFYAAFVYVVTYVQVVDGLPKEIALNLNTGSMVLLLIFMPIAAWLADQIGRKPMMVAGAFLIAFGAIPFFHLIHTTDPMLIFIGEIGFVLAITIFSGGLNAANVEMMPTSVRCTGLAFSYNASVGIFGGLTPLIVTWLLTTTGDPIAPAYWIAFAGALSLLATLFLYRETRHIVLSS